MTIDPCRLTCCVVGNSPRSGPKRDRITNVFDVYALRHAFVCRVHLLNCKGVEMLS